MNPSYKKAFTSLTILFFVLGFITCLNEILVPYLKEIFDLDFGQAALIRFFFVLMDLRPFLPVRL